MQTSLYYAPFSDHDDTKSLCAKKRFSALPDSEASSLLVPQEAMGTLRECQPQRPRRADGIGWTSSAHQSHSITPLFSWTGEEK